MLVSLLGGAYQDRSIIASAQRCVNLFPEKNPEEGQPPVPVTHYPTAGTLLKGACPTIRAYRCLYRATNGQLFAVVGPDVYYIDDSYQFTKIASITDKSSQCSMADNGIVIVLVDGTPNGYTIDMSSHAWGNISDSAFYGADRVDYVDTFFILNRPGTDQFYVSLSFSTSFDPTYIAAKTGSADPIITIGTLLGNIWLIGTLESEVFVNTGAADFPYQRLPGALIEHGCAAKYSLAKFDTSLFWLAQDRAGNAFVVKTEGYGLKRISTNAIDALIQGYSTVADAIGFVYQQQGHTFYVLTFPSADATWAYELQTGQWHELAWSDANGGLHRHRANACATAYGLNLVGDWQNGNLYELSPSVYTDNGNPIVRIRSFPHMISNGNRVRYHRFVADMQVGTVDASVPADTNLISLRWSDTRGASYGNPVMQGIGSTGDYIHQIQWRRLGMARDRIFEISWSVPFQTALNGAFVDPQELAS